MNNDKDRNPQAGQQNSDRQDQNRTAGNAQQQAGQNNDRQDQSRTGGNAQQQAGQPGVNQNAQLQAKQNDDLHRDATKEAHDQLSGAAGQQQAGKGNDRNQQGDAGQDANRTNRNAGGQQQADQKSGKDQQGNQQQGKDAARSSPAQGNQQK